MAKARWGDIAKGDLVELGGKTYTVTKAKAKGKLVKVRVERGGKSHDSEVRAKDPVTRAKAEPLHDATGRQQRWAKKSEAAEVGGKLPTGDATATAPPAPPSADPWETRRDKVERKLSDLLEARLVAETPDEAAGYYVPPVDVTTVAAHLALMHASIYRAEDDVATMLGLHAEAHEHAAAGNGQLAPNHWHTKTRPGVSD